MGNIYGLKRTEAIPYIHYFVLAQSNRPRCIRLRVFSGLRFVFTYFRIILSFCGPRIHVWFGSKRAARMLFSVRVHLLRGVPVHLLFDLQPIQAFASAQIDYYFLRPSSCSILA